MGCLAGAQVLGLDLTQSGFFSVLPWVTMAISANVGGWIADTMVSKGVSVTTVRKLMQTVWGALGSSTHSAVWMQQHMPHDPLMSSAAMLYNICHALGAAFLASLLTLLISG